MDLEGLLWSPDGRFLAIWDSCLEYKMYIYYPDGRLVTCFSAYDGGLGIKSVTWSPSSQFLAIGSYDQKVLKLAISIFVSERR
jgi:WD40 repeat protein